MMLDEALKLQCAACLDSLAELIPEHLKPLMSIVISHEGAGHGDAIVVGTHTLPELADVAAGMVSAVVRSGDVTADSYTPDPGSAIQ